MPDSQLAVLSSNIGIRELAYELGVPELMLEEMILHDLQLNTLRERAVFEKRLSEIVENLEDYETDIKTIERQIANIEDAVSGKSVQGMYALELFYQAIAISQIDLDEYWDETALWNWYKDLDLESP